MLRISPERTNYEMLNSRIADAQVYSTLSSFYTLLIIKMFVSTLISLPLTRLEGL